VSVVIVLVLVLVLEIHPSAFALPRQCCTHRDRIESRLAMALGYGRTHQVEVEDDDEDEYDCDGRLRGSEPTLSFSP
jgi:hypothetical protein